VQLQQALAARQIVGLAEGIIMARLGCSRDEAFVTLVQLADEQGVKLRQAAQTLVDRVA